MKPETATPLLAPETPKAVKIVLIDLSSIAYPIWHMSQSEPDPDAASRKIVERVRALASGQPHVAICCDKGKSFRNTLAPSYKANRPDREAMLHHQIDLAIETLKGDGFPVWAVPGFEADDLIAAATTRTLENPNATVLIASADKDLLQLVNGRVEAISMKDGSIVDAAAVKAKFGVTPTQMRDYLTLVGDKADNVKGVKGIGEVRAANLLTNYGSLDALYVEIAEVGGAAVGLTPSMAQALREFKPELALTRQLIALRTDVDLPFEEVLRERVPVDVEEFSFAEDDMEATVEEPTTTPTDAPAETAKPTETPASTEPTPTNALVVKEADILAPAPAEWERQLDPRSMKQAQALALDLFKSRMFSGYGTPHGVLSTILVGRELGIPAMTSLRCIHNIKDRHALSAQLIVALVLKSEMAEYFEMVELTPTSCTYETQRKGARNPVKITHTLEMAKQAGLIKPDSNWEKIPQDMLPARCSVRLARIVYPDICANVYTPEELLEMREGA